jgi:hypothetical protein
VGNKKEEHEEPTFLWVDEEDLKRSKERRVRGRNKEESKTGQYLKAKRREDFPPFLPPNLFSLRHPHLSK